MWADRPPGRWCRPSYRMRVGAGISASLPVISKCRYTAYIRSYGVRADPIFPRHRAQGAARWPGAGRPDRAPPRVSAPPGRLRTGSGRPMTDVRRTWYAALGAVRRRAGRCVPSSRRTTSVSVENRGARQPRINADVISGNSSANVDAMAAPADSPQIAAQGAVPRWREQRTGVLGEQGAACGSPPRSPTGPMTAVVGDHAVTRGRRGRRGRAVQGAARSRARRTRRG